MKESGKENLKPTIYESTLSTAGAVPLPHAGKAYMVAALPPLFSPFRMTIRESSSWRVGESFGKHTKSAPLGRGALFMCCRIVDDLIMISLAFPVDYFPVSLSALPVDVPKEE